MHTFVVLAYKESDYLEDCIKSVLNQKYKSKVVIATATPNKFVSDIASKYNLEIIENKNHKNIGGDFDFAISCADTPLVTVAHQDDIYDYEYSYEMVENYNKNKNAIILFSDYYELRNNEKVYSNTNLKIKRILLFPLKIFKGESKIIKRSAIRFGNAICCPAVTFVKDKTGTNVFSCDFKCDVDWYAWEKLSHLKGSFVFISKPLMGHRVHEGSTTTEIIHDNIRTKEDLEMFKKFWPNFIAKSINKFYMKSENSNKL